MRIGAALLAFVLALAAPAAAQLDGNRDEAKVPAYTLPDPLVMADGRRVTSAAMWRQERRPELLAAFTHAIYGVSPPPPRHMRFRVTDEDRAALGGLAVRRQVRVLLDGTEQGPQIAVLLYLPAQARGRVPVFVAPNFHGNQAVNADPAIRITHNWVTPATGIAKGSASAASRGIDAAEWPVATLLRAGYGVATYFTGDLYADERGKFAESIQPWYRTAFGAPDRWGAIATWAWGLSRVADYLATDPHVDARRMIVIGHSRYGKAALWAGANDTRFAAVIANDSGEGGASLYRRRFGETIRVMNDYWFAPVFKTYAEREAELPVDAHELVALIAPRPVFIASASDDWWSDPRGEFLAAKCADPVYRLLGVGGLDAAAMPPPDRPVLSRIAYHLRTGPHGITDRDWASYIAFADRYLPHHPEGTP
ncbi:alpha/beta hydrolase family protein [Sphingomonas sp. CLY1604]|uniref:alpha/beta hydrolase family protein n=1 Tax=Sphingomonas sp. CLY1604 TaxID=3457786 RepID=UPI003FD888C3